MPSAARCLAGPHLAFERRFCRKLALVKLLAGRVFKRVSKAAVRSNKAKQKPRETPRSLSPCYVWAGGTRVKFNRGKGGTVAPGGGQDMGQRGGDWLGSSSAGQDPESWWSSWMRISSVGLQQRRPPRRWAVSARGWPEGGALLRTLLFLA